MLVNLAVLVSVQPVSAQQREGKIDRIKTDADVEALLRSIDSKRFEEFTVSVPTSTQPRCQSVIESARPTSWSRVDFDGNGLTDLLVNGRYYSSPAALVVVTGANDNLSFRWLTRRGFEDCAFARVTQSRSAPAIDLYQLRRTEKPTRLVFKFDDFFEVNESPASYRIEQIRYKTSACFGPCPIFELVINSDRSATFHAENHNDISGKFKGEISEQKFAELVAALNYINFPELEDKYSVPWTDDQTSVLTIKYDGGRTKRISDYGLIGTIGLSNVYRLLFDLAKSQDWRR